MNTVFKVGDVVPPSFTSCTDPGAPPACANEAPKPTRLERAKQEVTDAATRYRHAPEFFALCVHELIAAAKAEAIAECEAPRYGDAIGTASASCVGSDFASDGTRDASSEHETALDYDYARDALSAYVKYRLTCGYKTPGRDHKLYRLIADVLKAQGKPDYDRP